MLISINLLILQSWRYY